MTIHDPDPTRRERLGTLLDALAPLLVRGFREGVYRRLQTACPLPLTDGTYPLLTALADGPATAAQVAAAVGVDRTVATKQATRLELAGLVRRSPHPDDARATLLHLTPAGTDVTSELRRASLDLLDELLGDMADDECVAAAARVLKALVAVPTS